MKSTRKLFFKGMLFGLGVILAFVGIVLAIECGSNIEEIFGAMFFGSIGVALVLVSSVSLMKDSA